MQRCRQLATSPKNNMGKVHHRGGPGGSGGGRSILGPDLWIISHGGLLRMEMPEGYSLVGYADDVAVTITARNIGIAQSRLDQVMCRVRRWMIDYGLELAEAKTEIVILKKKHIPMIQELKIGELTVQTKPTVKYLRVTLDTKLIFGKHIRRAADKAAVVTAILSRVMANIGGLRPCIVESIISPRASA